MASVTAQPERDAADATTAHVFNLGIDAGLQIAADRAKSAVIALAAADLDEDGDAQTGLDWGAYPLGLYLHRASGVISIGLNTPGTDEYELLDPDEADALATALHAYADAARSAA